MSKKLTMEYIQNIVLKKGGKCLSTVYTGRRSKYKFVCDKGHQWETEWANIHSGCWCPICANDSRSKKRQLNFDDLYQICENQGWTLLTELRPVGSNPKVIIKCSCGHRWKPDIYRLRILNTGCKYCNKYVNQEKCRFILNNFTGNQWISTRDIINPYELDMFCKDYNVAFEYNGKGHYLDGRFHKNYKHEEVKLRDKKKQQMCKTAGICLYIIHYLQSDNDSQLILYIKECLQKSRVPTSNSDIDLPKFYKNYNYTNIFFEKIVKFVQHKGGKVLSTYYKNAKTKMEFQCKHNHTWFATPDSVLRRCWCPVCAIPNRIKNRKSRKCVITIQDLQAWASKINAICLSTEYKGYSNKHHWKCCDCGREWYSKVYNVKIGHRDIKCKNCP